MKKGTQGGSTDGHPMAPHRGRRGRLRRLECRGWPSETVLLSLAAVAGAIVLVIAVRVRSLEGGLAIDDWFTDALVPRAPNGAFTDRSEYRRVARLGSRGALTAYVIAISAFELLRGRVRAAGLAATLALTPVLLAELVVKPMVGRTTVLSGALTFPSGTATAVAAIFASAVLLLCRTKRGWPTRLLLLVVAVSAVVAVDLAVIALSWHYATDVLAGNALAISVVAALGAAWSRLSRTAAGGPQSSVSSAT